MALFKILNNFDTGTAITSVNNYVQGYCYFDKNTGRFWIDTTNTADGRLAINGTFYGLCATAAATANKTVDCPGYVLSTGSVVYVRFDKTNSASASSLTLNVNGTGAKRIMYRNGTLPEDNTLAVNTTYCFVYDGTYYQLVGDLDSDTTYPILTIGNIENGTSMTPSVVTAKVIKDYIDSRNFSTTTGTVTEVRTNNGIVGGPITSTGTIGLNLLNTNQLADAAAAGTSGNANRLYAVGLDSAGKLAVNVPWTDNNTTYSPATTTTDGLLSATDKQKLDSITDVVASISPGIGISSTTTNGTTSIKTKLKSETAASISSRNSAIQGTQLYSVITDKDGYLAVSVPWTDSNTIYTVATQNTAGLMSAADKTKLDSLYEADGTGTVKSLTIGVGLYTDQASNMITQNGLIKAKLRSEALLSSASTTATPTANRVYSVVPDKDGYLSVVVPWTDTNDNTTYNNATQSTAGLMSAADKTKLDSVNANASVASITAGLGLAGGTITSSGTVKAKLKSETLLSVDSTAPVSPVAAKTYSVAADKSGYLSVYVPWTNTEYSNATTSKAGLLSATDKAKLDSIASGAQPGTVTSVATGAGLTGGPITSTGTIGLDLISTTQLNNAAANGTETPGQIYPVRLDSNGKLAVNVPWQNDNTEYSAMSANELKTGTATTARTMTAANIKSAFTYGVFATGTTAGTFKVYDEEIPIAGLGDLAYINKGSGSAKFLREDGTWQTPQDTKYTAGAGLSLNSSNQFSIPTNGIKTAMITNGNVTNEKLENSSISIAGNTISLGGSLDASTLTDSLGLSSALVFKGITTTSMIDNYNGSVVIGGNTITPHTGDVVIDSENEYEYVYVTNHWERLGSDSSYKLVQTAVTDPSASGTSTSFIKTISQNAQGVISATKANLPEASTTVKGIIQITATNAASFLNTLSSSTSDITDDTLIIRKDNNTYTQSSVTKVADYVKSELGISTGNTYLRKDGTWATPDNTTYSVATQSSNGLMSSTDKAKLDGIAAGAQIGTVTSIATGTGLTGGTITGSGTVKVKIVDDEPYHYDAYTAFEDPDRIYSVRVDKSGNLAVAVPWENTYISYNNATQSAAGLMSANDKKKLDGIAAGAQVGTVTKVTAGVGLSGGDITSSGTLDLKLQSNTALAEAAATTTNVANRTYPIALDTDGNLAVNVPWSNTTYSVATQSSAGLMSTTDKKKLDGITTYSVTNGVGIVATTTNGTTTVKAKLVSDTALGHAAPATTSVSGKTYPVVTDSAGNLAVNVPWQNDNTEYSALTTALIDTGTDTTQRTVSAKVFKDALNAYIAATDAMVFKGVLNANSAIPATHNAGWTYRIGTAGTYAGQKCEVGDLLICITDGTAANNAHWLAIQTNIDGAVTGPASATDGNVALFDGTTGKIIKQGTISTANVIKSISLTGATPSLGTNFSVPNVTANQSVTVSKVTKSDVSVITGVNQAASTSSIIGTVTDGVLTFGKAITAVGAVTTTSGTANAVTIADNIVSKVTLGTAFSIPNVIDVGSVPTLTTSTQTVVTGIS